MNNIFLINNFLKELLDPKNIPDSTVNGIQVECSKKEIKKILFAVDASLESINKAINTKSDLMIVHHGILFGKQLTITGNLKKRIELLIKNDIGLIAYHLPLDKHEEYGNNAQILKTIDQDCEIEPFGFSKGISIGFKTELKNSIKINEIGKKLKFIENNINPMILDFGPKEIKKICCISGSGAHNFNEVIEGGIDLFITGDQEHVLYHDAKENNINIIFAGHYYTETFGINAMKKLISKEFNVETLFCDIPTKL